MVGGPRAQEGGRPEARQGGSPKAEKEREGLWGAAQVWGRRWQQASKGDQRAQKDLRCIRTHPRLCCREPGLVTGLGWVGRPGAARDKRGTPGGGV